MKLLYKVLMAHQCQRPMRAIYRKLFVVSLTLLSTPPPQFVRCCVNMAADWKEDNDLNLDLEDYVRQNLKKLEILDFLKEKIRHVHVELQKFGEG